MPSGNPYLRLLSTNRDFRRLYVAQLVSFGGDWFLVVPLLGLVWELTGSAFATSALFAAQMLPMFLVSPIAGAVSDRFDRRWVMVISDLARVVVCVGFLFVDDLRSPALAFGLVVLLGVGTALFYPNPSAALPNLVEPEDLPAANVLLGSTWGSMAAIGAAIGGVFATEVGRDASFLVDAGSFAVSALLLASIRRDLSEARPGHPPGFVESARETVAYARAHPEVSALLTAKCGFGFVAGAISLLPLLSAEVFRAGDAGTGWLFAGRGLGALAGPFLVARLAGADDRRLMNAIGLSTAAWGALYVVLPFVPSLSLAAAAIAIAHLGGGAQWTLSSYGLQKATPDSVRGRIFGFDFGLVTLTGMASYLVAGAAAEAFGVRPVLAASGVLGAAFGLAWSRLTRRFWEAPAFSGRAR